jgi:hypothetical protein
MKHAVEMGSDAMIYAPSFIDIGLSFIWLMGGIRTDSMKNA